MGDHHIWAADQDPLLEKEEKLWKKRQAEYDPEDEAHSDIPVAKKIIDYDSICASPSLKTKGTSRSNVDSIVQCSIEDLQGDYLDSLGAIYTHLMHITQFFYGRFWSILSNVLYLFGVLDETVSYSCTLCRQNYCEFNMVDVI